MKLPAIISRETIKPSSPTPSHLRTYNLSPLDQTNPHAYLPMIFFYSHPKLNLTDLTHNLKTSLSQSLSRFYPLAGRLAATAPSYVDCNDQGVEFLQACIDNRLDDFLSCSEHETLDQLFPDGLVWYKSLKKGDGNDSCSPLAVQVTGFACGGIAVAVSVSHKLVDGCSMFNFIGYWASLTRYGSEEHENVANLKPHFIPFEHRRIKFPIEEMADYVTKSFMFPNSNLNELKANLAKVNQEIATRTMESNETNSSPSRVEALNCLLHKSAVAAATKANSGSFKPTHGLLITNMRDKMLERVPRTTMGNIVYPMIIPTRNDTELTPDYLISQLRKQKKEIQSSVANMEALVELVLQWYPQQGEQHSENEDPRDFDYYVYSSLCWFPIYVDFGWGKPVRVIPPYGCGRKNSILLLDTPDGDGIEAIVNLGKQEMTIFKNDEDLIAFCEPLSKSF